MTDELTVLGGEVLPAVSLLDKLSALSLTLTRWEERTVQSYRIETVVSWNHLCTTGGCCLGLVETEELLG